MERKYPKVQLRFTKEEILSLRIKYCLLTLQQIFFNLITINFQRKNHNFEFYNRHVSANQ